MNGSLACIGSSAWASFHVKNLTRSGLFCLHVRDHAAVLRDGRVLHVQRGQQAGDGRLLRRSAPASMGIWSSTLFGSGGAIQWQRWQGTLELLVAAPPPVPARDLPADARDSASIGIYSLTSTLLWGRLIFGLPFDSCTRSSSSSRCRRRSSGSALLGLVFASTFVLYRNANALSNMLEFPVWLVTGVIVPLSLLPGWARPIAWVLAPTWGIRGRPRGGLRRRPSGRDRHVRRAVGRLLRDRRRLMGNFERRGQGARDALARMTSLASVGEPCFRTFPEADRSGNSLSWPAGGHEHLPRLLDRRADLLPRALQLDARRCTSRRCSAGRSSRSCSSPTSAGSRQRESDAFFVVGNGIQVCAMSAVFGMAMTIGGERWTQTLGSLLATPANRAALFLGRALPNIANGVLVSAFGLWSAGAAARLRPAAGRGAGDRVPRRRLHVTCSAFGSLSARSGCASATCS